MKIKTVRDEFKNFGKTGSSKKIWRYYQQLTKSAEFNKIVHEIRNTCGIPTNGFSYKTGDYCPPREWDHDRYYKRYHNLQDKLCDKYELFSGDWWTALDPYIFFNRVEQPDIASIPALVTFSDEKTLYVDPFSKRLMDSYNSVYPVSIRISPYATTRDILDFVRKYSATIRHWQKLYSKKESKIGQTREKKKKNLRRNDFIFKNSHLPRKTIAELVEKKFNEFLDEGHISKIISLESKLRK